LFVLLDKCYSDPNYYDPNYYWSPLFWAKKARRAVFGEYGLLGEYKPHPDPAQEAFFFGLLKECLQQGIVTEDMLQEEMRQNHVRHDAFEVLERIQPLMTA
jgi:hypothetical protein